MCSIFTIRAAVEADLSTLLEIRRSAILHDAKSLLSAEEILNWANQDRTDKVRDRIHAERLWIVALSQSPICAWGSLREAKVDGIYVRPEYQRRGCGKLLLEFLEDILLNEGHRLVTLSASLNAVDFYKRCSYVEADGGRHTTTVRMSKTLAV